MSGTTENNSVLSQSTTPPPMWSIHKSLVFYSADWAIYTSGTFLHEHRQVICWRCNRCPKHAFYVLFTLISCHCTENQGLMFRPKTLISLFLPFPFSKYAYFFHVSGNEKWAKSLNPISIGAKRRNFWLSSPWICWNYHKWQENRKKIGWIKDLRFSFSCWGLFFPYFLAIYDSFSQFKN